MKTSRPLIAAVVLAAATLGAPTAFAADISHAPEAISLTDGSAFFGGLFTGHNADNIFADKFTFTTTSAGTLTADLFSQSGNIKNGLDITAFGLYGAAGLLLGGTQSSTGLIDSWMLSAPSLAAGSYYLQVMGTVNSNSAGKYYASATLAPVPEPETYGMMLAGLGLVGVMARRRKSAAVEAA